MQISDPSIRCAKCGYSLMGQSDPGSCPDCGNRFSTRSGKGFTHIRETHRNVSGTGVLVAMLTGFLSLLMVPVCLLAWIRHLDRLQYNPAHPKPLTITLFTVILVVVCIGSISHFLYHFWKVRSALKEIED